MILFGIYMADKFEKDRIPTINYPVLKMKNDNIFLWHCDD